MISLDFSQFHEICEAQDVQLHPRIVDAGKSGSSSLFWTYEPTSLFAAIGEAGRVLYTEPSEPLASKPIKLTPSQAAGTLVSTLANVTNAQLKRLETGSPTQGIQEGTITTIETCDEAEVCFEETLDQLKHQLKVKPSAITPFGVQIITDGTRPLILRKGRVESGLTLEELTVGGIPYPAGSLVNLLLKRDVDAMPVDPKLPFVNFVKPDQIEVIDVNELEAVRFTRLSIAALSSEEIRAIRESNSPKVEHEGLRLRLNRARRITAALVAKNSETTSSSTARQLAVI